eukprot:jgi/Bigna1/136708/aug1.35_g11416
MNEAPQPTLWPTVTIVDAKDEVKVAVLSTFATVRYSLFSDDKKLQFKNEYKIALAISTGVLVSKVVVSRITAGSTVVESEISTPTEAAAFALQSTITNQPQAVFSPTNGFNVTIFGDPESVATILDRSASVKGKKTNNENTLLTGVAVAVLGGCAVIAAGAIYIYFAHNDRVFAYGPNGVLAMSDLNYENGGAQSSPASGIVSTRTIGNRRNVRRVAQKNRT